MDRSSNAADGFLTVDVGDWIHILESGRVRDAWAGFEIAERHRVLVRTAEVPPRADAARASLYVHGVLAA